MPDDDIRIPKHRYDDLINAAGALATVTANAVATILEGTPYESMLRGPTEALEAALREVPGSDNWDGSWDDSDVEVVAFRHHSQPDRSGPDSGAKAIHKPSGLSVESYLKSSFEENKSSASKALRRRVEIHARNQGIGT